MNFTTSKFSFDMYGAEGYLPLQEIKLLDKEGTMVGQEEGLGWFLSQ